MNILNPLFKELFEISGQNVNRTPQPQPRKKAPQKKAQPKAAQPPMAEPKKEEPEIRAVQPPKKERTVAGIPVNSQTLRQSIIMSEIIGKPICKRK